MLLQLAASALSFFSSMPPKKKEEEKARPILGRFRNNLKVRRRLRAECRS